ncbi:hypothetical protein FGO68_gene8939 [Halteria grandinella]|uniref:Uncharacterized protein n=1 Tax=Halteria grandinella TaxID=5974 RepID=A0A8J8NW80_HALGN|nr:hypothetical protein FGO68_gene8939 [Halteria grandinella]
MLEMVNYTVSMIIEQHGSEIARTQYSQCIDEIIHSLATKWQKLEEVKRDAPRDQLVDESLIWQDQFDIQITQIQEYILYVYLEELLNEQIVNYINRCTKFRADIDSDASQLCDPLLNDYLKSNLLPAIFQETIIIQQKELIETQRETIERNKRMILEEESKVAQLGQQFYQKSQELAKQNEAIKQSEDAIIINERKIQAQILIILEKNQKEGEIKRNIIDLTNKQDGIEKHLKTLSEFQDFRQQVLDNLSQDVKDLEVKKRELLPYVASQTENCELQQQILLLRDKVRNLELRNDELQNDKMNDQAKLQEELKNQCQLVAQNTRLQSLLVNSQNYQGIGFKHQNDQYKLDSIQGDQQSSSANQSFQKQESTDNLGQTVLRSVSQLNSFINPSRQSPTKFILKQTELTQSPSSKNNRPSNHKAGVSNNATGRIQEHVEDQSELKQFNLKKYYDEYIQSFQILQDIYSFRYGQFAEIDPKIIKEKVLKIPNIFNIISEAYTKDFSIKEALQTEGQMKDDAIKALNRLIVSLFMKPELHQQANCSLLTSSFIEKEAKLEYSLSILSKESELKQFANQQRFSTFDRIIVTLKNQNKQYQTFAANFPWGTHQNLSIIKGISNGKYITKVEMQRGKEAREIKDIKISLSSKNQQGLVFNSGQYKKLINKLIQMILLEYLI